MSTITLPNTRMTTAAMMLTVFLPFAFGHFLSLMLRNINAMLAPGLMASLQLSAGQLGMLTSVFFLTYALVQLPVGMALDRYGARRVQLVMLLVAAAGALLFSCGRTFGDLVVARALMGLGLGACFMSALKAIAAAIAPEKAPSVHGYLIAVGGIGSASGTLPVRTVLQYSDWRGLFVVLAVMMALAGLLIWILAPREPAARPADRPTLKSLGRVFAEPQFRKTVSLIMIPHAVFFGMQGLWLGRMLSDVARISEDSVAWLLYLSMAAVIFGAIAVGMATERAVKRGIKPHDLAAAGIALFLLVQVALACGFKPGLPLLVVLFTLTGTITGMEYTIVSQSMPRELTGRASTCLNLMIFSAAFLVQALFGQIVGLWPGDEAGRHPAIAYQVAMGVMIVLQLPGLVRYALSRRSRSRNPELCGVIPALRPLAS